jgi:hypothetical protein
MTHRFLCDEIRQTTYRIDGLLRLQDCERKLLGQPGMDDIDEVDLRMARWWRGWRDGYISWHLDCRRYRLVFLKCAVADDSAIYQSFATKSDVDVCAYGSRT